MHDRQRSASLFFIMMSGLFVLPNVGSSAAQTTYPEKPIRMVVGFPPGNSPDIVARLLGHKLGEAWERQC